MKYDFVNKMKDYQLTIKNGKPTPRRENFIPVAPIAYEMMGHHVFRTNNLQAAKNDKSSMEYGRKMNEKMFSEFQNGKRYQITNEYSNMVVKTRHEDRNFIPKPVLKQEYNRDFSPNINNVFNLWEKLKTWEKKPGYFKAIDEYVNQIKRGNIDVKSWGWENEQERKDRLVKNNTNI